MEDLKAYIESGILELYVLGDLPEAERMQVEEMIASHTEVRAEVIEIEKALELTAQNYAVEPTGKVKENLFSQLFPEGIQADPATISATTPEPVQTETRIVEMPRRNNFYKYGFAASLALLAASVITIIYLNNELENSKNEILAIQQQNQKFANQVNYLDKKLESKNSMLDVYRDPNYKLVKLAGTKLSPQSGMTIAWNPKAKKVAIDKQSLQLPENDTQHQYQLWALVDGKPVDLGVFDMAKDSSGMLEMKSLAMAQAFAVTREPRGGSVNPTLDQMVVMGAIAQ